MRISLPVQLLVIILTVFFAGGFVSKDMIRGCYTFSLIFKELLSFFLPYIVFSFVLGGILSFKKNAPVVLLILIGAIFASNALAALSSYLLMSNFLPFISCTDVATDFTVIDTITSFGNFTLPVLFRSEHAMIAALISGLFFSFVRVPIVEHGVELMKRAITNVLYLTVIPLLPLYVLGFLLKMRYEGLFMTLMSQYGSAILFLIALQTFFLIIYYFVATRGSLPAALNAMQAALPSYLTAFGTMSSTATIPVTVDCAVKNTGNQPLATMAIPIMANVHLLGDSVGVPILALTTTFLFQGCMPTIVQFSEFLFFFCTSMFAVSGIPGGGIIVMIPVLKSVLGFTPEMVSVITTLYILLDSFGTAANVMGDGALVIVVNNILKRLKIVA